MSLNESGADRRAAKWNSDAVLARLARTPPMPLWRAAGLGAVFAAVFLGLRWALSAFYQDVTGFMILLPGVILAALAAGRAAGFTAVAVCLVGGWLLVGGAVGDQNFVGSLARVATVNFILVGIFSTVVAASLRATVRGLELSRSELDATGRRIGRTEAELQAMVDQASAGIARVDLSGRVVQANARFAEILGRPLADAIGVTTGDVTHPDDIAATREVLSHALTDGHGGAQIEKRYIRPDGRIVWAITNVRLLTDPDGRPDGYIAVLVDITAAKQAEAALRESEQRFRAVADTAPVLIWITRADRRRDFVNQAYVAFMGGDYESVRDADWRDFIHPDDHDRVLSESLAGEATAQPFSMEARYRRADGAWRWLKSFSRPRLDPDGAVIGFVGVAFDVTDMREAQARLEESEARFRVVADSAPAMMWMMDADGLTTFGNRRYRTFFSVRSDRRLTAAWRRLAHPDDLPRLEAVLAEAYQTRKRFETLARVEHPLHGERWLRSEGAPRFDAEGVFQGFVGVTFDVTAAHQAETDLKRINELLEERVGAALAEKEKAEADLVHANRMEAVGRLTGGVAHDFNNLLTVIIGALDIILRTDDPTKQRRLGEAALGAARRGERLTNQLLAFSRRQTLRPEPTDLNALIREGEPLLRRAVGEDVSLNFRLKRGAARVLVDPAKFEAALLNLIVNARDAVRPGGLVEVRTETCEVGPGDVPDLAPGRYLCVAVSDDGEGMSAETLQRVFEPFFTTKSVGKGTGLGLSQVYGFARQSGGGVRIRSDVGQGTEMRLYLPPLTGRAAPAGGEPAEPLEATGTSLLLVEDDAGVAAIASDILAEGGFQVRHAETAAAAIALMDHERFDIMVSDVVMPGGMSGVELARRCAARWPEMKVVLTSGYPGEGEALRDAPWPFLPKPYSAEQLRRALGRAG